MKSLQELAEIRARMKDKVDLREGNNEIRIVVGMATCGIAAGARPVLNTLVEEVDKQGLGTRPPSPRRVASASAVWSLSSRCSRAIKKRLPTSR